MIGQGVLRECLLDPDVERVVSLGRSPCGVTHAKLRDLVHKDLFDLSPIEPKLTRFDACFDCLGPSSSGMSEADYERLTYSLTTQIAETLCRLNPQTTFIYISGAGTDGTEKGRVMWARVKGRTENALLRMDFKAAYMFRIAAVLPAHGERSRTTLYRLLYSALKPLTPLFRWAFPGYVLTTEDVGQAMLKLTHSAPAKKVLESPEIRALVRSKM